MEAMMDVMCKGANRTLKRHAEETYEALVLPHVEKHVNSAAEYERLRFMFYWRIVSEYAKKLAGRAGLGAAGGGGASGDDEEVPAAAAHPGEEMMGARVSSASGFDAGENLTRIDPIQEEGWTKEVLFRSYLHSVSKGEFLLKRQVEEDGVGESEEEEEDMRNGDEDDDGLGERERERERERNCMCVCVCVCVCVPND